MGIWNILLPSLILAVLQVKLSLILFVVRVAVQSIDFSQWLLEKHCKTTVRPGYPEEVSDSSGLGSVVFFSLLGAELSSVRRHKACKTLTSLTPFHDKSFFSEQSPLKWLCKSILYYCII